ncbi:hypothetical protein DFH09DRAFT_1302177 [Mycena vulgaris]|nr:hypothetical protein DFH09DRAFT_1302177 [Mycena vulgaris]
MTTLAEYTVEKPSRDRPIRVCHASTGILLVHACACLCLTHCGYPGAVVLLAWCLLPLHPLLRALCRLRPPHTLSLLWTHARASPPPSRANLVSQPTAKPSARGHKGKNGQREGAGALQHPQRAATAAGFPVVHRRRAPPCSTTTMSHHPLAEEQSQYLHPGLQPRLLPHVVSAAPALRLLGFRDSICICICVPASARAWFFENESTSHSSVDAEVCTCPSLPPPGLKRASPFVPLPPPRLNPCYATQSLLSFTRSLPASSINVTSPGSNASLLYVTVSALPSQNAGGTECGRRRQPHPPARPLAPPARNSVLCTYGVSRDRDAGRGGAAHGHDKAPRSRAALIAWRATTRDGPASIISACFTSPMICETP